MEKLIRAKHWQIFIIVFALPALFDLILKALISEDDNLIFFHYFDLWLSDYFVLCIFGWTYAIGIGLQSEIPLPLRMKVSRFKASLVVSSVYIIFMQAFSKYIFPEDSLININKVNILNILPFLCIFYAFLITAKTIKTVQLQRKVIFWEYALESLMIFFFPIGIWILQLRINRMKDK
jgi:hypothetical protein